MHPELDRRCADKMGGYGLRGDQHVCGNPSGHEPLFGRLHDLQRCVDRFRISSSALRPAGGFFPYHLGRFRYGMRGAPGSSSLTGQTTAEQIFLKNLYFRQPVYHGLKRSSTLKKLMVGAENA